MDTRAGILSYEMGVLWLPSLTARCMHSTTSPIFRILDSTAVSASHQPHKESSSTSHSASAAAPIAAAYNGHDTVSNESDTDNKSDCDEDDEEGRSSGPARTLFFAVPHELPAPPYREGDVPWCWDVHYPGIDRWGRSRR